MLAAAAGAGQRSWRAYLSTQGPGAVDARNRIGRGDQPNRHDILTGSQSDGTAYADAADHSCRNWTSGADGSAQLGHHDRLGLRDEALRATGGAGLLYCFAAN